MSFMCVYIYHDDVFVVSCRLDGIDLGNGYILIGCPKDFLFVCAHCDRSGLIVAR